MGFEVALHEIETGEKRGHWIWYVFPQLSGLGSSGLSRTFAIADNTRQPSSCAIQNSDRDSKPSLRRSRHS